MRSSKKVGLVLILGLLKSGLSPSQISKKYNIPKQNISYYVGKLKKLGCIEKKGYGTWDYIKDLKQVKILTRGQSGRSILTSSKKEIRGHAFIWKIEFLGDYNWFKIVRHYKKKLTFRLILNNKIPRTIFNNRKIWLTKKGLVIYEPIDFFGKSSFDVKGTAVFEMDRLVKAFLKELNLKFKPYRFTTSREHYGMIKNELARQYNDRKEKLNIKSEDGTTWLWIDDSKSLGELETADPNISRQVQNFWNNHKAHSFKVDADFILKRFKESAEQIKANAENHSRYAKNLQAHVESIKQLGNSVQELTKIVKELKK